MIFHRLAARNCLTAPRWYARRSARAAQGFRAAVDQVVVNIARAPQRGSIHHGRFRWMRARRYPYVIYYEV
ncbi:MAG TPA: type II toxin-antitoxin system RelE/ParE family toxin, partial [Gemmataceae bacterium]|nr:type II toxin-antitoxin system RelE/ParE family toxin [Gemmataceae bacterium]